MMQDKDRRADGNSNIRRKDSDLQGNSEGSSETGYSGIHYGNSTDEDGVHSRGRA